MAKWIRIVQWPQCDVIGMMISKSSRGNHPQTALFQSFSGSLIAIIQPELLKIGIEQPRERDLWTMKLEINWFVDKMICNMQCTWQSSIASPSLHVEKRCKYISHHIAMETILCEWTYVEFHSYLYMYWLVVSNICYFPFLTWDVILPIDELIFFQMGTLHHQPVIVHCHKPSLKNNWFPPIYCIPPGKLT